MDLKASAISGAKWTTLSSVSNALLQFLRIVILARLLEKSDFGLMAIVAMIMGFTSLFTDMGIGTAILHKQEISDKEYNSLYWMNFFISIFLFIIIFLLSFAVAEFYREPQLKSLIPLMGVNLLFIAIGRQYALIAQKKLQFKFISITEISTNLLSLFPAVFLAVKGYGVYSLIYSTLFASLFSNLLFVIKMRNAFKLSFHFRFLETISFLKIGVFYTGGQILNYFNTQFDVILLGRLLGTDLLGTYNLCKNLAMRPAQIINPIITKISAPLLAKMQDDYSSLKRNFLIIIRILSLINYPIYFMLAVLSPQIIRIVYGINDPKTNLTFSFLALYYMLRSTGNPISGLVIAKGRTDIEFYWNVGITLFFPLFIYLGAFYSTIGVASSQFLLMVLAIVPSWYFLIRKLTHTLLSEYVMQMLPYLFYSLIAGGITFFVIKIFVDMPDILSASLGFIIFTVIYGTFIYFMNKKTVEFLNLLLTDWR